MIKPNHPAATELSGSVEHITYSNEESGFTVARVRVSNRSEPITVVGPLMGPAPGTHLKMKGHWIRHPEFGRQFHATDIQTKLPATANGIKRYLASGMIKGIGSSMAERIVAKFGKKTLQIIENHPQRLTQVEGIGFKRVEMIRNAWNAQKEIRQVMLFLQSYGISTTYATKIFKHYGQRAINVVRENPYRLADDIAGIGFLTADRIAAELGFAKDSVERIQAGILYILNQLADNGHVFFPYEKLISETQTILQTTRDTIAEAIGALTVMRKVIIDDLNEKLEDYKSNLKAVYLAPFYTCETRIAKRLHQLIKAPLLHPTVNTQRALAWVQQELKLKLAQRQIEAVAKALTCKALVITGGPGTGKTTIVHAIIRLYQRLRAGILLAAPTGRAAKRLSETTGRPAKTIHRLLEFSVSQGGFQRNDNRPLDGELLIVDEASMIDTVLMHHLIKALPLHITIIFVGDADQLPSVGPGNVLQDIITSAAIPVVQLNQIFRQAQTSQIIQNAHRINAGQIPQFNEEPRDFFFIEQNEPDKALDIILKLIAERIPQRFGFDPMDEIQVLTPMHRSVIGSENLNRQLQDRLNPQEEQIQRGEHAFRLHDKVMQIRNNYEKDVFNGDIGYITRIDAREKKVYIRFESRTVDYDFTALDEIVLAYAISVHKSQGSEYPAVVVPVMTQHYVMLQRNLIYTAITRARRLVVIVGTRRALAIAVNNNKPRMRYTRLAYRLAKVNA